MLDPMHKPGRFGALVGYRLVRWEPDTAVVELVTEEKHMNRSGVLHGGVLTTLVDVACGYAGTHAAIPGNVRRAFTVSLSTQFIAPVRSGTRLRTHSRKTGGGRSLFFAACEVRDENDRLIGRGEGVFKYLGESWRPEGLPPDPPSDR